MRSRQAAVLVFVVAFAPVPALAQVQPVQTLQFDIDTLCRQLADPANDTVVAAILRSQLSGIGIEEAQVAGIRRTIAPRACTRQTLERAVNHELGLLLARREIRAVQLQETDSSRQAFMDAAEAAAGAVAPLPEVPTVSAEKLTQELTGKVDRLASSVNARLEGVAVELDQLKQLNLPKRPMQIGSEIVYTYAGVVGRRWTPSMKVPIDGKLCGSKKVKDKDQDKPRDKHRDNSADHSCTVVELKEEGQFSCWEWDEPLLFFRTCYELTIEEVIEREQDGKRERVSRRRDVDRARDDLPSEVYLPMLLDAERHAGTTPIVGDTTHQRLVNIQRSRNEQDYERTRAHLGALAAVNAINSQALLTAAALHLYLAEQPPLPGRLDLFRRTSLMILYGRLDLGAAKAETLGAGAAFDIVRGFSLSVGYSRYTLDTSLDASIPVGTQVHTGNAFAGLSINTEVVNNNRSLAGFFGR
jgi:hypothetical protein